VTNKRKKLKRQIQKVQAKTQQREVPSQKVLETRQRKSTKKPPPEKANQKVLEMTKTIQMMQRRQRIRAVARR